MRKLLSSIFLSIVWILPAAARDGAHGTHQRSDDVRRPDQSLSRAAHEIERNLRKRLASAGFHDIHMAPTSFLIGARDAKGEPVLLMFDARIVGSADSGNSATPDAPEEPQDGHADRILALTPLPAGSRALPTAR